MSFPKTTMLQFCNECYLFFNSLIIREKYFQARRKQLQIGGADINSFGGRGGGTHNFFFLGGGGGHICANYWGGGHGCQNWRDYEGSPKSTCGSF